VLVPLAMLVKCHCATCHFPTAPELNHAIPGVKEKVIIVRLKNLAKRKKIHFFIFSDKKRDENFI